MKKIIIAAVATALVASVAPAMAAGKKHHVKRYHHHYVTRDGYFKPGIPTRDPGRYSNLPGKDAQYSKAYIRDH